jgi:hypothetical protein
MRCGEFCPPPPPLPKSESPGPSLTNKTQGVLDSGWGYVVGEGYTGDEGLGDEE